MKLDFNNRYMLGTALSLQLRAIAVFTSAASGCDDIPCYVYQH